MKNKNLAVLVFAIIILCGLVVGSARTNSFAKRPETLKEAFKAHFMIGAALSPSQFFERDPIAVKIITEQFNTISPENVLKWQVVHPRPDTYDFKAADQYVTFGENRHMFIVGHTLVWHNQVPEWVFRDDKNMPLGRTALLARMRDHISTVVGRYKGRIRGWDVVNEAITDDGRLRQSPWQKIIGDDYIEKAFEYAHEADPNAELYYNDFSLENEPKRAGALRLIAKLKAEGIPITAVGLQGHDRMNWPSLSEQETTITAFAKLGVHVNITELDVDMLPSPVSEVGAEVKGTVALDERMDPYRDGLPADIATAQAKRYADLFRVFVKHSDVIDRVTFWGVTDKGSWLNSFPMVGRTNYPLLFDRAGKPKPAFASVLAAAGD